MGINAGCGLLFLAMGIIHFLGVAQTDSSWWFWLLASIMFFLNVFNAAKNKEQK